MQLEMGKNDWSRLSAAGGEWADSLAVTSGPNKIVT